VAFPLKLRTHFKNTFEWIVKLPFLLLTEKRKGTGMTRRIREFP
jgi:hypothetical protein